MVEGRMEMKVIHDDWHYVLQEAKEKLAEKIALSIRDFYSTYDEQIESLFCEWRNVMNDSSESSVTSILTNIDVNLVERN